MEMQHVRYFLALSRTLNFTRAAEASNVSQPALTRAIQQLEHEMGGPLFHRERNRTHLSELGRIMLPYFEGIQAQADAAREHARSLKRMDQVTLQIGAMCTIGPAALADLFIQFQMANPNVQIAVQDYGAQELLANYRTAIINALVDTENALVTLRQTTEQETLQAAAETQAERAYNIAEAQLRAGTIDLVTLLITQQTLFNTRDTLTRVRLARLQAAVGLFKALGGGWEGSNIAPRPVFGALPRPSMGASCVA